MVAPLACGIRETSFDWKFYKNFITANFTRRIASGDRPDRIARAERGIKLWAARLPRIQRCEPRFNYTAIRLGGTITQGHHNE